MAYQPSPRPTFDGPAPIPYEQVTRHLWGDDAAGRVADWIYVSSNDIHQLVFGLPAGGWFRHSDQFRTIFAADELLYVVQGMMAIANPETGEVHRVRTGEAAFFRQDTWHHCYSYGPEPLRVLEIFAPPPSQGTSGAYAQTQPLLTEFKYGEDQYLGRWPQAAAEASAARTITVLREEDALWQLEGPDLLDLTASPHLPVMIGILASTEQLTAGFIDLLPGQRSAVQRHDGEESLYVLEGMVNVYLPEQEGPSWFELKPGDGFYLPRGAAHQYHNIHGDPARLIFGVAPNYQPPPE